MTKYKLKIIPEGGGYIGHAILNDEVVFTTSVCRDTIAASRQLSQFVASQNNVQLIPINRPLKTAPVPAMINNTTAFANNSAPASGARKCCGRG